MKIVDSSWSRTVSGVRITAGKILRIFATLGIVVSTSAVSVFVATPPAVAAVASTPSCSPGVGVGGTRNIDIARTIGGHGCVVIKYFVNGAHEYDTFNYTGSDQTWTVPQGITRATVYLVGAGGGASDTTHATYKGGNGGGGGYAQGVMSVTAGTRYTVVVGQAGGGALASYVSGSGSSTVYRTPATYGGGGRGGSISNWIPGYASGGGRSAIRLEGTSTDVVTAGGGGGAGSTPNTVTGGGVANGGPGGGVTGIASGATYGGGGGTQIAGGAGGISGWGAAFNGTAGTQFQGGNSNDEGGGGGGGWYGGGGGADSASANSTLMGGWAGGGGSSYVALLTHGYTNAGSGTSPGGVINALAHSPFVSTTPTCVDGAGLGGATTSDNAAQGGNGCVVIQYVVNNTHVYETFSYAGIDQPWTVPSGVTSVIFHAIGAGGGGGRVTTTANGGGGGYAAGSYAVTPGDDYTIIVGQGGRRQTLAEVNTLTTDTMRRNVNYGGGATGRVSSATWNMTFASGGGRSAIRLASGTEVMTAGGGGGGGYTGHGGAGGGATGVNGSGNAGGGTQIAGGAADTGESPITATPGIQFAGGFAGTAFQSGGGGGGWHGGGGGASNRGGGGGSSYITLLTSGTTSAGNGRNSGLRTPVNTTPPTIAGPSGKAVGTTLTATGGVWSVSGAQSWQWQRSTDGTNFTNISGAHASTFVTTQGGFYRVIETRSNLISSTDIHSSNVIQQLDLAPTSTQTCVSGAGRGGTSSGTATATRGGHGCVVMTYTTGGSTVFETFNFSGNDQTWTVPSGVTSVVVHLIGAGGGGATAANMGTGGAGGYATGGISVTPGDVYTVIVGEAGGGQIGVTGTVNGCFHTQLTYGGGGQGGSCPIGGYAAATTTYSSGGGRSAIRLQGVTTDFAIAAGGGGGGYGGGHGAAGGGLVGGSTPQSGGGTQIAGGLRTGGRANGTNGSQYLGGRSDDEGGGGGGGYWGGAGGGDNTGGGGGSSYIALLTNGSTTPGNGSASPLVAPANTAPPTIAGAAAIGANLTATSGVWATSGTKTWRWQFSTDGVNFTDIVGATSITHSNTQAGYYRVVQTESNLINTVHAVSNVIRVLDPVVVDCTPTAGTFTHCKRFNFYGAAQTFTVPHDMPVGSTFTVELWGAGGGGIDGLQYVDDQGGGAGGYQKIRVPVTQVGQSFALVVGEGGMYRDTTPQYGGGGAGGPGTAGGSSGGGYSGIFHSTNMTTPLAVVGGGGGASPIACCGAAIVAGGGGGIGSGGEGTDAATAGRAGTTTAGGAAATRVDVNCIPTAGTFLQGGNGCGTAGSRDGGGGGGGGYFGGGGGIYGGPSATLTNGSGGGGSGYVNSAAVTSVVHQPGPNGVRQNFSYPLRSSDQWVSPVGIGGKAYTSTAAEARGGHGMVVVQWALPPAARPDSATGGSTTAITVLPASNDTGSSGATINASSVRLCAPNDVAPACAATSLTIVNEGTYSVNTTTGVVTFTGDAGFIGTSTATYSIADSRGTRTSSTISFTTLPPPTARPDASAAQKGDNQSASPLANDFAAGSATMDLDSLRLCGISPVESSPSCTHTSLSIANEGTYSISNGVVVFTADAQYTGTRVLDYIVRDSTSQVATSTITFTALPPPAVSTSPESLTVAHAATASFAPLSNDSAGFIPADYSTQGTVTLNESTLKLCSAGETIATGCTKTSVVIANEGTWTLSASAVTFVPLTTFSGTATSMPYMVCNSVSGTWSPGTPPETCGSSVMSVTVNSPTAPVPQPDLLSAQFGNRTSIHPLANDQGASLSPTRMRLCDVTETVPACFSTSIVIANEGTWTLNTSTGLVEFEPLPLFTGTSTITYMATDIVGTTFSSSISATIQTPALPSAQPDTASGTANSNIVVAPLFNDAGTGLSFSSLRLCNANDTAPSCSETSLTVNNQGTWSIDTSNGDITFTPHGGFVGTASAVTYSVLDLLNRPTSSTITVTVSAIAVPSTPNLLESSDTGSSSTDNVTKDVTPAIRALGVTDGDTVTIAATNGTTTLTCTYVVSVNVTECDLPVLSDGTWTITTTRTDSNNNISAASAPLTIVVDTTPPNTPMAPTLDSASDDGISSADNITSVMTPTVGIGSGASGETVTMTATQGSTTVTCTYDAATATTCELQTLSEGTWLVAAIVTDSAGNDSISGPALTVVIESSTPVQNVPATAPTTVPTTTTTTVPNTPIQVITSASAVTTTTVPTTATTLPNSQIPYTIADKDKIFNGVAAVAGMPKDGWVKVEKSDSSITITTSDGLLIKIGAKVKSSVVLRLNSRGMPIFEANDFITIAGGGLKPFTPASTWLFSTPRQLGVLTTDSNGAFNEEYSIGEDVEVGDHTAQLNGIAPDGTLRVVEVAVEIVAAPEELPVVTDRNTEEVPPATPLNTSSTIALLASALALLAISRQRTKALSSQVVLAKTTSREEEDVDREDAGGDVASVKVSFGDRISEDRPDRIRVPRLQWIDGAMKRLACAIDRRSPMLARITDDGAYARSLLGLLWPLLPIAGVALGIVSAFNTEFVMMIPALSLVVAIAVLGVIDAFAGFMFVVSFGISMMIGGGFDSVDSVRGYLGIAVFSFAPVMIAAATRPFRRVTPPALSTWNRSVDFVLTALFGSWAAGSMYGALPSLTTYKPEHSDRIDLIHVVFLVAIAVRWICENAARIYMPRRLRHVEVEEFEETTRLQRMFSDIIRTAVFVFVAIVFIGNNWALWTGAAMFLIPNVIGEFSNSFKNRAGLYRFVPRKLTRVVMMLFVGLWWGQLVENQFGDSENVLLYAFVLLSIPGITLGVMDWFVRDGKKWESTPLSRVLGVLVLIVGIMSVRGMIP